MTLAGVFDAYDIAVPSIGAKAGSPLYDTLTAAAAAAGFPSTDVGICASSTASRASGVPGTEASTREAGLPAGIIAKSRGSWSVAYVHGPAGPGAENQRPLLR